MKLFARLGGEQLFFEQFDGGRSRFADDLRAVAFGMDQPGRGAQGGTRHGREACRDGTARAAFRRGKGLDAVGQEFMHPLLGLLTHAGCEGEECTDG